MSEGGIKINEYGVGYLRLTSSKVAYSDEVSDGVIADYDSAGRVVGIEFLDAKRDAPRVHDLIVQAEAKSRSAQGATSSRAG